MLTTRYHLDEEHLKYYDEKLKSWASSQPVKTIPSSLYPWTLSEKAGAASLWPAGGTPLKPTVDFLFTEVPPASGDKGPDNPSTITGVSSVRIGRIGGKNLLAYNFSTGIVTDGTPWGANPTITNNAGTYTIVGTHTGAGVKNYYIVHVTDEKVVIPAGTYTISGYTAPSGAPTATGFQVAWYNPETGSQINNYRLTSGSYTFTVDRPVALNVYFRTASNTTYPDGFTCSPQLEFGDTATAFEPSRVDLYDIPLGSTYYGGTLDVASGVMTVTHGMTEIGGSYSPSSQNFQEYTDCYRVGFAIPGKPRSPSSTEAGDTYINNYASDILPVKLNASVADAPCISVPTLSVNIYIFFTKQMLGVGDGLSFNDLKPYIQAWLSLHPIHFAHLVTPTTSQLSPTEILSLAQADKYTPRLNTLYTDAQAVQVGYVKSPIREEFELQQAIVAQGGNV